MEDDLNTLEDDKSSAYNDIAGYQAQQSIKPNSFETCLLLAPSGALVVIMVY